MKVKMIQLINNYYRDDGIDEKSPDTPMGSYSCFGYYDALRIEDIAEADSQKANSIYKMSNRVDMKTLDGTCNRHNLTCICSDDEKDDNFWKLAGIYPYLFLIMIRIDRDETENIHLLSDSISELNCNPHTICYSTYEQQSEVIVLRLADSYFEGVNYIKSLDHYFNILKTYSIFSVKQDILKSSDNIINIVQRENVRVFLRAVIKSKNGIDEFLRKLSEELKINDVGVEYTSYTTLGSTDLTIELESVSIQKLLFCYRVNGILNHTNSCFARAFYNLESELLPVKEKKNCGSVD